MGRKMFCFLSIALARSAWADQSMPAAWLQVFNCALLHELALVSILVHELRISWSLAMSSWLCLIYFEISFWPWSSSLAVDLKMFLQCIHTLDPLSCLFENVNFWALPSWRKNPKVQNSFNLEVPLCSSTPAWGCANGFSNMCSRISLKHWPMLACSCATWSDLVVNKVNHRSDFDRSLPNSAKEKYKAHVFLAPLANWLPGWSSSA